MPKGTNVFGLLLILSATGAALGMEEGVAAFPGAEGFGATSVGGRGGRVIKVTNLEPSGPGSLQAACEAKGPRFVVFEVSGVIHAPKRGKYRQIVISDSNIAIAGQTAPGTGITIDGMLLNPYRIKPNARRDHPVPAGPAGAAHQS
ncbi:MAG: hypothetical protein AMS14_10135 [Planctomycetes bacterium DG_20]|nr:MAG: hypothetical protein AMS14_10135 [Planctomycetes bacterium DG_20]